MVSKAADYPEVRLHDLSYGHASIQLTLDTYSHIMPSMQDDAAAIVDGAMRKALNKRREP